MPHIVISVEISLLSGPTVRAWSRNCCGLRCLHSRDARRSSAMRRPTRSWWLPLARSSSHAREPDCTPQRSPGAPARTHYIH